MGVDYIVSQTKDFKYIRDAVIDPYVWRWAANAKSPRPGLYFPHVGDGILWARINDYGVLMARKTEGSEYEVHVALNRSARGAAVGIARAGMAWLHTQIEKPYTLVANIPEANILAARLAKELGFTKECHRYIYRQEV